MGEPPPPGPTPTYSDPMVANPGAVELGVGGGYSEDEPNNELASHMVAGALARGVTALLDHYDDVLKSNRQLARARAGAARETSRKGNYSSRAVVYVPRKKK